MGSDTKEYRPPKGLICPIITPLTDKKLLDEASLEKLIRHVEPYIDAILLGDISFGEVLFLNSRTREDLIARGFEIIDGRLPILVTITDETAEKTNKNMYRFESIIERSGYTGEIFWVDYPIYYHSNRKLPQFYRELSENTKIPFIIGNDPRLIKNNKIPVRHKNIRTSIMKNLANLESIKGLIFSGTLNRALNYQKGLRDRKDFRFYDGNEGTFLKRPSSSGVVAGGANLLPEAWRKITYSSLNLYDVQREYRDYVRHIWRTGSMLQAIYDLYGKNPGVVMKYILYLAGLIPNSVTASGESVGPDEERTIKAVIKEYEIV
nr:dihydrodipicolinate synthase family protein [Desulfobacterales bacterium]